ncbi:transcriptional regulator, TetR family [Klenkia soli]|uniref:Transcriptional regulator, TetR family n=1 Tax=Klenkia soli TaxID=1052260 RepID=A0A1H0GR43_9ACTN|nr:TetR family transcriptional regulator [Klenkia soli]SDO09373.1 transcriptional regulator, TetR family [Klenkia soli]
MANRADVLAAAQELLATDQVVSLDSVARAVGLTKPGLMHYFATKQDLMLALVDASVDALETQLVAEVGDPAEASAVQRMRAYAVVSLRGGFGGADLAMLADARLRGPLTERWVQRMHPWVDLHDITDPAVRGRLTAVRMLADGAWLGDAGDYLTLTPDERPHVLAAVTELVEGLEP